MKKEQFKENLFLYGTNIHQWPEMIRQSGVEALERAPELRALVEEYEHFEKVLALRRYEEPSAHLAQRIISAASPKKQKTPLLFIAALLNEFRLPKPVFAALSLLMIFVLIVGFILGFSGPSDSVLTAQEETTLQTFLYDEGEVI